MFPKNTSFVSWGKPYGTAGSGVHPDIDEMSYPIYLALTKFLFGFKWAVLMN